MTVETIELQDAVSGPLANIASGARSAEGAVAELRSRIKSLGGGEAQQLVNQFETMNGVTSSTVLHLQAEREAASAVTSEIQKQISLQAKIASFDANRFRETRKLEGELKKLQTDAAPPKKGFFDGVLGKVGLDKFGIGGGGEAGAEGAGAGAAGGAAAGAAAAAVALKVVSEIVDMLKAAAVAAVGLAVSTAQLAIQMSDFKHESIASLAALTGSSSAAGRLYEDVRKIGRLSGEGPAESMGRFKKLLSDGFDDKEALGLMREAADIAAVRGDQSAQRFVTIIEGLKNKGTADKGFIKQVAKAGIDSQEVYKQLAAQTHKSIDQVKADLKAGTVASKDAVAAVEAAAKHRFGGAAQKRADNSVSIQALNVGESVRNLFSDVDLTPVAGMLRNINKVLEGGPGQALKASFKSLFGGVFDALFGALSGGDAQAKIGDFVTTAAKVVGNVATFIKAIAPIVKATVGAGLDVALGVIKGLDAAFGGLGGAAKGAAGPISAIATAIAFVGGFIGGFIETIGAVVGGFIGVFIGLYDAAASGVAALLGIFDGIELPDLGSLGGDMLAGLVEGIESGAASVIDSLVSVCTRAVRAAKSALGINSPSKVFASIGDYTAEGFAGGIAANDAPQAAAASMAEATSAAAAASAPTGSSSGRGGAAGGGAPSFTISPVIQVSGASSPEAGRAAADAAGDQVTQMVRDAIDSYWRQRAEEAA